MSTEMSVMVHTAELHEIVDSVFRTMLSLEIRPGERDWYPDLDRLAAAISLSGAWDGTVRLECDRRQACRLTGRFLSMDAPDSVDEMVRDVFGELANMIGGNLKCVLTSGVQLSLPSLFEGHEIGQAGGTVREHLALATEEGEFWVSIVVPPAAG